MTQDLNSILSEMISEANLPIKSLKTKKDLNWKIWERKEGYRLNREIRYKIMELVDFFVSNLKLDELIVPDITVKDVVLTGSLANYNWSEYSDLDIHIRMDYSNIDPSYINLLNEFFDIKSKTFTKNQDIRIAGFPIEIFIEPANNKLAALGVYSVLNDEWIIFPKKHLKEIDWSTVKKKAKSMMKDIDQLVSNAKSKSIKNIDLALDEVKSYWKKIKLMRKSGLQEEGEFSVENLIFKLLRRNGYISRILDAKAMLLNKKLSYKHVDAKR